MSGDGLTRRAKPIRTHTPAAVVCEVAGAHAVHMPDYVAREIADAVLACYDSTVRWTQLVRRVHWEEPRFRDHTRQMMRHHLLETVTSRGLVPVGLPSEGVRHRHRSAMFGRELNPAEGGELDTEWDLAEVTLRVPVRTPPVDRRAAVKAGVL